MLQNYEFFGRLARESPAILVFVSGERVAVLPTPEQAERVIYRQYRFYTIQDRAILPTLFSPGYWQSPFSF
jgi:hypothetical protein